VPDFFPVFGLQDHIGHVHVTPSMWGFPSKVNISPAYPASHFETKPLKLHVAWSERNNQHSGGIGNRKVVEGGVHYFTSEGKY
jgi:hypothetical protein